MLFLQREVDDPELSKKFLQDSLKKRENNEVDDIQTLVIINKIKRKLNHKDKVKQREVGGSSAARSRLCH